MKMKLMKNKKYLQQKFSQKVLDPKLQTILCRLKGQQELCPFYMLIPYDNK